MESKAKIRRMYHIQGFSIKEIVRKTGISRNTVRTIIRGKTGEHSYKRTLQPSPSLGAYKEIVTAWLQHDAKVSRKEKRTAKKYYEQLKFEHGYTGSYDNVQRFVKSWKQEQGGQSQAYIPLLFSKGEAYQFDWSEETVLLNNIVTKLKVAHFRLCYSRKFFVIAYFRESQEMLFDAHAKAFEYFGGLCERGIYDNMKTAVKIIFTGKERKFNDKFLALMDHYLIEPTACTPASGWEKGQVENQVETIRKWLFSPRLSFDSLSDLNDYLRKACDDLSSTKKHPQDKNKTISQMFEEEKLSLKALPGSFSAHKEVSVRITSTCLIQVDNNRYSVACDYANKAATVKLYVNHLEVYYEHNKIACHPRYFTKNKVYYDPWHYVPLVERKPGALRNGAPFQQLALSKSIRKVGDTLLKRKGGDKEFVQILLAIMSHGVEHVEVSCSLAINDKTINKDAILNIIHRLREQTSPEKITTPVSLSLTHEPAANCHQYDQLLKDK